MDLQKTAQMFNKVTLMRKPVKTLREKEKEFGTQAPYSKDFFKGSPVEEFHKKNPSTFAQGGKKKYTKKELKIMGEGFWDDFKTGFMDGLSGVVNVAKTVAPLLPLVGLGKKPRGRPKKMNNDVQVEIEIKKGVPAHPYESSSEEEEMKEKGGKKKAVKKPKRQLSDKMKRRAQLIKKLMSEGMSMIDASKKIASEKMEY